MSAPSRLAIFLVTAILCYPAILLAQYTLVLKNGRRITVQAYREEGQMIKVYGIGGEIGLPRDQIQSIFKAGEEGRGLDLRGAEGPQGEVSQEEQKLSGRAQVQEPSPSLNPTPPADEQVSIPLGLEGRTPSPEEERAKEEREYQQKVREITEQLKDARDRYSQAIRGTTGPEPTLVTDPEQIKAMNDDMIARLKDAQRDPVDPGVLRLLTPSGDPNIPPAVTELRAPPSSDPRFADTPTYTDRQKTLSDLRNQTIQLEKERERLINELRQKNFGTGSLFLE
jgi:hypothetical protein